MRTGVSQPPASAPPPQFFVDSKKGEVNELRTMLRQTANERDQNKRREVIKKVIAYMTLGVDVSRLFADVALLSSTNDIVQKKMIYLYLTNYAESNSDQALMAINTFFKDCKRTNPDPKIRGLALRNLCSLRFSGVFEYIQPAISETINDPDPYVRRTAIIGLIKLYHSAKDLVKESPFIDNLYELIRDGDSLVSCNAILALNEILGDEGGIAINRRMVIYLLNRINGYSEFAQSIVFDLVAKYQPQDENELFDIMNIMEDRLKHSSSSVVLGCVKVFLNFTKGNDYLTRQVYARVQAPLITLFVGGEVAGAYELSYTVLSHIHLLVSRGAQDVFESDYKHFFCKFNEPLYIKSLKIDILTMVAGESNLQEIVNELSEYVTDVDVELSRKAVRCVGRIAMRLPTSSASIIQQLLGFLKYQTEYVITETLMVMKDLLRKYRSQSEQVLRVLEQCLEVVADDDGKAAVIWMIGEFGEYIEDSPYLLEHMIHGLRENQSLQLSHALLTATVKLFLKRPPEVHPTLALLFQEISTDTDHPDLRDRAVFYYRLLKYNLDVANEIVNSEKHPINLFREDDRRSYADTLCEEFNTLSVVYQKPSRKFVKEAALSTPVKPAAVEPVGSSGVQETDDLIKVEPIVEISVETPETETLLRLDPTAQLTDQEFESSWMGIEDMVSFNRKIIDQPLSLAAIESLMSSNQIICKASGEVDDVMKLFFFAKAGQSVFFLEVEIVPAQRDITVNVKTTDQGLLPEFLKVLSAAMSPIINFS